MAIYSEVSHQEIVIFHSFVSLPEGSMKWITPADFQFNMKTNMAVVACDATKFIQGHPK